MAYELEDVFEMNKAYADSFWRPSDEQLAAVAPGMLVKLLFVPPSKFGERIWVEVIMRSGDSFRGKLRNSPLDPDIGAYDDVVSFEHRHIADISTVEEMVAMRNSAEL